jgi:hypothetical protein
MKLKNILDANSDLWFLIQLSIFTVLIIMSSATFFTTMITDAQILKVCYVWLSLGLIQIFIGLYNDWSDK